MLLLGALLLLATAEAQVLERKWLSYDDVEIVWRDKGSGAKKDFSMWRVKDELLAGGYHRIGHYYGTSGGGSSGSDLSTGKFNPFNDIQFTAYVVREKVSGSGHVAHPTGYTQIWNDRGSGANWNGAIWRADPPAGYKCLGNVGTREYDAPSLTEVVCVKESNTEDAANAGCCAWTDKGSGADADCYVYEIGSSTDFFERLFFAFSPQSGHTFCPKTIQLAAFDAVSKG